MKVKFNDHAFEIRQDEEGLFSLKDVERGWHQSGGKGKRLEYWASALATLELQESLEFRVIKTRGPAFRESHVIKTRGEDGGSWGNKVSVLAYAIHCSEPFQIAVLQAFEAMSERN